jgi:hypothetical protein
MCRCLNGNDENRKKSSPFLILLKMIHLLAVSLLTILAGTLLLAKFKKDNPGKFFAIISWFFIVVGFILFIGFIGGGICRMSHHCFPGQGNCQHEMMMKGCDNGMSGMHGMHGMQGCSSMGMDKGMQGCCGCCSMGMDKEMDCKNMGAMSHDSMMKCCPEMMKCDSAKMCTPKK